MSTTCPDCGGHKDSRAVRCRACENRLGTRIGKSAVWNRKVEQPIADLMANVETTLLQPDTQQAFGYVIGTMLGDGCIYRVIDHIKHHNRDGSVSVYDAPSYRVRLSVTSEAFARYFAEQWRVITGRTAGVSSSTRTDWSRSTLKGAPDTYSLTLWLVDPRHALFARYLHHLKYETDHADLLRFPDDVLRGIIQGMIDSEGYVNHRYVDIANRDRQLLEAITRMFERLGQHATVYTSPSQNISHLRTFAQWMKHR